MVGFGRHCGRADVFDSMNSKSLVDVVDDEDSLRRLLLVYISRSCIASNLAQLRHASHVPQLLRLET